MSSSIQLLNREDTKVRTEFIGFRCTPSERQQLEKLAEDYNTTRTDILIQLIRLAAERRDNNGEST